MAYKIKHRSKPQEIRFPNQRTAQRYVDQFGGDRKQWNITVVDRVLSQPAGDDRPSVDVSS